MSASEHPPRWVIVLLIVVQAWLAAGFATGAVNLSLWSCVLCGLFAGFLVFRIVRNARELVRRSRLEVS